MRDILIEFLRMQLRQQIQLSENLSKFIQGLSGEIPTESINVPAISSTQQTEQRSRKGNVIQFIPRNRAEQRQEVLQQQKKSESECVSDKGATDMQKVKPVLRKDGRYQLYVSYGGKRHYVYANTERECRHKRAELEKELKKNPQRYFASGVHECMTLYEFGIFYVENFKKQYVVESTYKQYLSTVKKYLNSKTLLCKLRIEEVQGIINVLPMTSLRGKVFSLLVQILKKAYALDFIKKHLGDLIEKGKTQDERLDALSIEDQQRLVQNLDLNTNFGKRVMFYLLTGARPAEMRTVAEIKKGFVHLVGTKTKHADRWIKLSESAMTLFENEPVEFYRFDLKRFRQRLQKFVEQHCEIKSYVTLYTLRHTFATNLYYLGCPDKERAAYMGHTTTKTTNDFYTSLDPTISAIDIKNIYGDFYPEF